MNNHVSYAVLTVVLLADISAANAQDVIVESPPGAVVTRPASTVDTVPVETVETVKTVRSVGHGVRRPISHHLARSRPETIVTTTTRRTILRERIVTAPAALARAVAEPAYTDVVEAPPAYSSPLQPYSSPLQPYSSPLYDVATPPAVVTEPVAGAPVAPAYRYVYEPDRILVIDPVTGIAVQPIPR